MSLNTRIRADLRYQEFNDNDDGGNFLVNACGAPHFGHMLFQDIEGEGIPTRATNAEVMSKGVLSGAFSVAASSVYLQYEKMQQGF